MELDQSDPSMLMKITSVASTYDISDVNHKSSDTIKYKILTDTQNFPRTHQFPQQWSGTTHDGRPHMHSFSLTWLDECKSEGLIYSVKDHGAFCKYYKLFAVGDSGALAQMPFCRWKNARSEFEAHFWGNVKDKAIGFHVYNLHSNPLLIAAELIKQGEGKTQAINQVLDLQSHMKILKNRKIVKSIAKTVHFLAN